MTSPAIRRLVGAGPEGEEVMGRSWLRVLRQRRANQANSVVNPSIAGKMQRSMCETDGHCYRPPGADPRLVRWVCGDDAFVVPTLRTRDAPYGRP